MVDFRNLRGFWRFGRRNTESERLDSFLKDLADPSLIESLQRDDDHRRRWLMTLSALVLGLLVGGLVAWRLSREAADPAPSEELAHSLAAEGLALVQAKEIAQAWDYLRLAIETRPNLAEAWAALGLADLYGGQTGEAERAFRRCIEIEPQEKRCSQGLGDVYFYSGDTRAAEEYWLKGDAKRSLARLRLLQGRFAEAAPLVDELARQTPDPAYIQPMAEAIRTGRLTPELRWRLAPGVVASRSPETARGWRLYFARHYEEAAGIFEQVLARTPGDGSARIGRGWCRLKTRSYREAEADFQSVLSAWPSNYSVLNGLGWCLKGEGRTREAAASWERALELQPEGPEAPEILKGLGMLAFEEGEVPRANRYLTRSLLLNPHDPETRTLLTEALKRLS